MSYLRVSNVLLLVFGLLGPTIIIVGIVRNVMA